MTINKIINNYESDNEKTLANLSKLLNFGKLGGTGKLIIYPGKKRKSLME